jgi:hypothetical protein
MHWQDQGKFSVQNTMGEFIPALANSNKKDLKYEDILTHQAKLKAWIPFWQDYIDSTDMIVHSKKFNEMYAKDDLKYSFVEKYFTKSAGEERVKKIIRQKKDLWATCVDIKTEVTRWKPFTLSYAQSDEYPVQVAPNLWAHRSISNQIFEAIKSSPLREKKEYVYSDLSYYLLPQMEISHYILS